MSVDLPIIGHMIETGSEGTAESRELSAATDVAMLVAALEESVAALAEADLVALVRLDGPSRELHDLARRVERVRRMLGAFDAHYVQACRAGDEPARHAQPSVVAFLRQLLRVTPAEAARRARLADAMTAPPSFGGEPAPPPCPAVTDAVRVGGLSAEAADVVVRALTALPVSVRASAGPALEEHLVAQAQHFDPSRLAVLARHAADVLDPDGSLRDDVWQRRNRTASLRANPDGTGTLHALLTTEALEKLQTVLSPLAAPVAAGPEGVDPRTGGQRLHDGLLQLADQALTRGDLPASGGSPTTVVIHLTEEQLRRRAGFAISDNGHLIPVGTALELAQNSVIYTLVTTSTSVPLWLGRTSRTASPGQTIALAARDRGCAHPGCDRPPAQCERHHIRSWAADGGPTDLDNLLLYCGYHHRITGRTGWEVVLVDGLPWHVPPAWVDPERRPVRNTMHDPLPGAVPRAAPEAGPGSGGDLPAASDQPWTDRRHRRRPRMPAREGSDPSAGANPPGEPTGRSG